MIKPIPMFRCLLPLLAAFAAACAGGKAASTAAAPRPSWVDGESPRWPRARFVIGVGLGDDESAAADRARAEVAKVFSTTVSVDTNVEESETNLSHNASTSRSFSQNVAQKVRTAAKRALEGVDVVERWKDPATGQRYALAVLPKSQALLAVEEKSRELDEETARWNADLAQASERFSRAKAAAKLLALTKSRDELAAERRVLGGAPEPDSASAAGAARAAAAKALAALDVAVSVEGDGASEVETGIVSGLNAAGLSAKHAGAEKPDLAAAAKVAIEPAPGADPRWKWSRATASVTLQDGREGKTFARFDLSAREASADAAEARRRALSSLGKKVSDKVADAIGEFFADQ